jgi:hypothetical protein
MRNKLKTIEGPNVRASNRFTGIWHYQTCFGFPTIFLAGGAGSFWPVDTCVHRLDYEKDACSERPKDVKEQGNLNRFQLRLAINGYVNDKD